MSIKIKYFKLTELGSKNDAIRIGSVDFVSKLCHFVVQVSIFLITHMTTYIRK